MYVFFPIPLCVFCRTVALVGATASFSALPVLSSSRQLTEEAACDVKPDAL